jgi:hypothetical protein
LICPGVDELASAQIDEHGLRDARSKLPLDLRGDGGIHLPLDSQSDADRVTDYGGAKASASIHYPQICPAGPLTLLSPRALRHETGDSLRKSRPQNSRASIDVMTTREKAHALLDGLSTENWTM